MKIKPEDLKTEIGGLVKWIPSDIDINTQINQLQDAINKAFKEMNEASYKFFGVWRRKSIFKLIKEKYIK